MKFNKKMVIMLCSTIAIILAIIIVLMLIAGGRSKVLSYFEIEQKIVSAGRNYYKDNENKLPVTGSVVIDANTLISEGYLNDLSKYTEDGITCSGKLYVIKNPSEYSYRASLNCGSNYTTQSFKDLLLTKVTTNGSGLYETIQVNPDNIDLMQTVYVYKGDNVNNYIKVGDYLWQIVKITEEGNIVVVESGDYGRSYWDDRYNIETDRYRGINNYKLSRIREYILSNITNKADSYNVIKSLITEHTSCIGKRSPEDNSKDGSTECSSVIEGEYFSLLPVYDYISASLDENCNSALAESCSNYNYLSLDNANWWLVTANAEDSESVYYSEGALDLSHGASSKYFRLMAYLDANVTYVSGTGTYEDPYILK